MFTGIIEAIGTIGAKQDKGGDVRLRIISSALDMSDVKLGDSIATNGVCLTVVEINGDGFWADVSNETIRHSSLNNLSEGAAVNLEKAMLASSRFGGHIVSGHVDGVGEVIRLNNDGRSVQIEIAQPASLTKYIAHKGSITIDGVSLTVNELTARGFLLNIVPHTVSETIIANYQVGSHINLEVDVIARYLEQLLKPEQAPQKSAISKDFLAANGFYR
ncbi:MAG: riboflavin synthase [Sinobacterium sp.]|nr:riboflavin synthase [Sinobacterium sp.]